MITLLRLVVVDRVTLVADTVRLVEDSFHFIGALALITFQRQLFTSLRKLLEFMQVLVRLPCRMVYVAPEIIWRQKRILLFILFSLWSGRHITD